MLSLTDFISLNTRDCPTVKATGMRVAKGGCLCGKITFEFTRKSLKTVLCHCKYCRRLTGMAYSIHVTVPSSAMSIRGQPKQFVYESGRGQVFKVSFCDDCSSVLWKESDAEGLKGFHLIQSGALGPEHEYRPQGEIFMCPRSKCVHPMGKVKQFEGADSEL